MTNILEPETASRTQLLVHLGPNVLNKDFPHGRLRSAIAAAGFTSVERSSLIDQRYRNRAAGSFKLKLKSNRRVTTR